MWLSYNLLYIEKQVSNRYGLIILKFIIFVCLENRRIKGVVIIYWEGLGNGRGGANEVLPL